ncbi:MAG: ATP phosphoribosyltransferase regulatory subunit [Gammaproteobacteria bacterium]|nr:ATP phosphoribosyltransferase regulatory subunit [Gammaproteobacteria bacterium]
MTSADRWLLPEGVEEILPEEAFTLESLRRQILDLYASWGYQLVITPLIEYLDSLLVGSSHDLDLHTFKLTDQLSGRMMGIRADMTPQVARIDAHCLNRTGPVRLCYADSVLHTRPRGLLTSRVPIRVGAELFGHSGVEADVELICLMHQTLAKAEIADIHLVLGHVGIFRTLVDAAKLDSETESELFAALQRKAYAEIDVLLQQSVSDDALRSMLYQFSRLSGDFDTLQQALEAFKNAPAAVRREIEELEAIANGVCERIPDVALCFDLCELRGYEYHTGIVFAAYTPEYGRAVAKGGRYDDIGEVFGRARPASGFDCDLKTLAKLTHKTFKRSPAILAPADSNNKLMALVDDLRQQGETVIINLSADTASPDEIAELDCDRRITLQDGCWIVESIE